MMSRRPRSALDAAFQILARRDHFVAELEIKLRRRGFDQAEVDEAVQRCIELGYLDDARAAERFVEQQAQIRGWGPLHLVAEMRRRGVEEALAERMVAGRPELARKALALSLERLERREAGGWWKLHARKGRMVSSLINRGFEAEEATGAVLELAAERERQHHAFDEQR
jgi:SOS response regulatory protein OraA/RecX